MFEYNNIIFDWIENSCFRLTFSGIIIYIDPFRIKDTSKKADLILITHEHYDHCSIEDLKKIIKPGTTIVTVADCQSKLSPVAVNIKNVIIVSPGSKITAEGIAIEAVPAYNIGKQFHPQNNDWVGFVISINGTKIYHAGDTDLIPEMKSIHADIAMLPVGGTYLMDSSQATQAANTIMPKFAIPMHYGSVVGTIKDAKAFEQNCKCKVVILDRA